MTTVLTKEGFEKITNELDHLQTIKIPYVENRVKEAVESGVIAVIKDAQEEHKFITKRIPYLQNMIATAKVLGT
jgi:transcription elongation GreA/GreB family factor